MLGSQTETWGGQHFN